MSMIAHGRHSRVLALAVAGTMALTVGACSSKSSNDNQAATADQSGSNLDTETPTPGGSVTMGVPAETEGWNPAKARFADAGSFVATSVLEPLFFFDKSAQAKPYLAESATPNGDNTQWTIKLRPGITFHDGTTMDAASVKKSLDANLTDPTSLSYVVLNPLVKDVQVVDPQTVQVNLKVPWAVFPTNLASSSGMVMAPSMIDSPDAGMNKPIGTGPFVCDSWKRDDTFVAKKNPNYWRKDDKGNQLPYLESVSFKVITDDATRSNALLSSDVDLMITTSADVAKQYEGNTQYRVLKDYGSEKTFVMLQTEGTVDGKPNPFSNIHARRALAYGTDRTAAAAVIGEGIEITTSPMNTDGPWGLPEDQTGYPAFDATKAQAEVDAYKKDTGASELAFTLVGNNKPEEIKLLQGLAAQWAPLGIKATVSNQEQTSFLLPLVQGNFQAAIFRNGAWPDPDAMNYFYNSANIGPISVNFSHLRSQRVDDALNKGRVSADPAVRKPAYDDFAKGLNDEAVNIWLYNTPYALVARSEVRGLTAFADQGIAGFVPKPYWDQVWVKR